MRRNNHCVVGVFDDFDQTRAAIQALEASDFPAAQVSLATHRLPGDAPPHDLLNSGDETESQAGRGAGVGALVGLLLGTPLLLVPGLGQVLIAGPLLAGLTGGIVGGLLGSMTGWGVHEDHVKRYEALLREGKFLVIAHGDPREIAVAQQVLQDAPAAEIVLHAPDSADAPEIVNS